MLRPIPDEAPVIRTTFRFSMAMSGWTTAPGLPPPNLVILLTGRSAYHGLPVSIIRVPVSILPRRSDYYGSAVREVLGHGKQSQCLGRRIVSRSEAFSIPLTLCGSP